MYNEGIRLGRLKMFRVHLTMACWKTLWNAVSKLSKLEKLMLSPGSSFNRSMPEYIDVALWSCSHLSKLTTFSLGTHTNDNATVDITKPVLTLLYMVVWKFSRWRVLTKAAMALSDAYRIKSMWRASAVH
jgi:hypothetical protein